MSADQEMPDSEREMINRFRALRGRDQTEDKFAHFTTRGPFADMPVERQAEILAGSPMTAAEQEKFNQSVTQASQERTNNPASNSALNQTR